MLGSEPALHLSSVLPRQGEVQRSVRRWNSAWAARLHPASESFVPLDPYGVYFLILCHLSFAVSLSRSLVRECCHGAMAWIESAWASPPGGPPRGAAHGGVGPRHGGRTTAAQDSGRPNPRAPTRPRHRYPARAVDRGDT